MAGSIHIVSFLNTTNIRQKEKKMKTVFSSTASVAHLPCFGTFITFEHMASKGKKKPRDRELLWKQDCTYLKVCEVTEAGFVAAKVGDRRRCPAGPRQLSQGEGLTGSWVRLYTRQLCETSSRPPSLKPLSAPHSLPSPPLPSFLSSLLPR